MVKKSALERSATGRASKSRGEKYELEIIKKTLAYFNGLDIPRVHFKYGDDISRAPLSGAGNIKTDVLVINPLLSILYPLMVEIKYQMNWTFDSLMNRTDKNIMKWSLIEDYFKCARQSYDYKLPVVVFSKTKHKDYILFSESDIKDPGIQNGNLFTWWRNFDSGKVETQMVLFRVFKTCFVIMDYMEFLKTLAPARYVENVRDKYEEL